MRNKFIDLINGVLKDQFDFVPVGKTIEITDSLLSCGATLLPCKVGDIGFAFSTELKEVVPYCVDEIHIDEFGITFEGYVDNENGDELDRGTFTGAEVGKVIFFGDNAEIEAQQAHANRMKGAPEWMLEHTQTSPLDNLISSATVISEQNENEVKKSDNPNHNIEI